jgi:hypothetical protein
MKIRDLPISTKRANENTFAIGAVRQGLRSLSVLAIAAVLCLPAAAQDKEKTKDSAKVEKSISGQPSESEMMAMMTELAKPGENHKMLAQGVGEWTYKVKMYMSPGAEPMESSGTASTKAIMDGRFFVSNHSGKFQMPGPDGKMMDMNFKGMAVEGYDNAKKKFVSSWIDNMGTGIMNIEGTYDAGTKTFTFTAELEMMPGMKTKIRELIKIVDKDHHTMEWYEDRGGTEVKTMEIAYTRKS